MTDFRMAIYDDYGDADVIRIVSQAELPVPNKGEVRLRVHASSVNPKDTIVRKGRFKHLTGEPFPHRMGYDFAATIDAVTNDQEGFEVGERVYGFLNNWAGGAFADYVIAKVNEIAKAPHGCSAQIAAVVPLASQTALQALRDVGSLRKGQSILINGASGGVGYFAVQIAKTLGAVVTAVASDSNEKLCRDGGADNFLCYDTLDFEKKDIGKYDLVFDVFGNRSLSEVSQALTENGIYITTVPNPETFADIGATQGDSGKRARMIVVESRTDDLAWIAQQLEQREIQVEIDRTYPLEQLVEAHRHVETKHTRGKVCVLISQSSPEEVR